MDTPLSPQQLSTLKAAMLAETDPAFVAARTGLNWAGMAAFYNAASTFVVWKSRVQITEIGDNLVGTEVAGLSTLNNTRLQTIVQLSANGVNPALADRRAFFDDVFGGAGGALTRAKLLALWKRLAKRGERIFASGTGNDAAPGLLTAEGEITERELTLAMNG